MYGTLICVDCGKEVQRTGSTQVRCPSCQKWHKARITSERQHKNYMKKKGDNMLLLNEGNILDNKYLVFCHQVNCKGVMGAGLAKQIKAKYPEVYREYKIACMYATESLLGTILPIWTTDGRICINMFAQDDFGCDKRYTDYDAFKKCLAQIEKVLINHHIDPDAYIAFPYGIGCGLAGGDWTVIQGLIRSFAEKIPNKVVIVKLGD